MHIICTTASHPNSNPNPNPNPNPTWMHSHPHLRFAAPQDYEIQLAAAADLLLLMSFIVCENKLVGEYTEASHRHIESPSIFVHV